MGEEDRRHGGWIGKLQQGKQGPVIDKTNAKHRIQGFERFGFNVLPNKDIVYREWAPNALRAYLVGDFSMYIFSPL